MKLTDKHWKILFKFVKTSSDQKQRHNRADRAGMGFTIIGR